MTRGKCRPRCWYAYYGYPGSSSPVCVRCGHPNPRYRQEDDPFQPSAPAVVLYSN
jgi:hypothetical protein